jgi:hypothetical protein
MSLPAKYYAELSIKEMEEGIQIKEWGRLARMGAGLGYGGCTLGDGVPDDRMTAERFEEISKAVGALPAKPYAAIRMVYMVNPGGNYKLTQAAIKLGCRRDEVEAHRDSGLNLLYGMLCMRITA